MRSLNCEAAIDLTYIFFTEDVMYTGQATWFSTQGSYLAFATFNDTEVGTYSYYYYVDKSDPDDLYPELVDLKYPKVNVFIYSKYFFLSN